MRALMCARRIPSRLPTATILLAAAIAGRVSAVAQTEPPAADQTGAASTAAPVSALTDSGWPRVIVTSDTRLTVYRPQVDSWDGFRLEGRAAVAVAMTGDADARRNERPGQQWGISVWGLSYHIDERMEYDAINWGLGLRRYARPDWRWLGRNEWNRLFLEA